MKMPVAVKTLQPGDESRPRLLAPLLACLFIFGLALAVRLIGLPWGLPNAQRWYSYHPDESINQIVGAVNSLLNGDFNPHFFNYPSLTIYATWIFYWVLTLAGAGTPAPPQQTPWPLIHDIILAGRLFSVLCGASTAVLVYLIGKRLGGGKWAFLGAILTALAPGHVQHSHFATVDVPATFFVTLCIYLTLRASATKGYLWAALVAGLAAGTKYNAGLVLMVPLLALWLSSPPKRPVKKLVGISLGLIAISLVGFFISTPYAALSFSEFWGDPKNSENGFAYELFVHPKIGSGDIFRGTGNGWIYHLTFNLPFVLTWPLILGAGAGIYFAAKKREFWPLLAFLGIFFLSLGLSQVRFMRYLLVLVPGLCVLAAYGASRLPAKKVVGMALVVFALIGCSNVLSPLGQTDPRDQALAATKDQRLALEEQPWFLTPPYQPGDRTLSKDLAPDVEVLGHDENKLNSTEAKIVVQSEIFARERERLGTTDGFDKLLLERFPTRRNFKNTVPLALPGREFVPHDYLYTNPQTRVYSRP